MRDRARDRVIIIMAARTMVSARNVGLVIVRASIGPGPGLGPGLGS